MGRKLAGLLVVSASLADGIARLLGYGKHLGPNAPLRNFSKRRSWSTFAQRIRRRVKRQKPSARRDIALLSKIAAEPQANQISRYSEGGSPAGIYSQAQKVYCQITSSDPGSIPIITTYFLHPTLGGCPTNAQDAAYRPTFEAQINALARATGRWPVIFLLELDYVGSSSCISRHHQLAGWESLMRYEARTLGALPHTEVYIEGGYSDADRPEYAARVRNASGVRGVAGFFTNDTHNNWTTDEIRYAQQISRRTGGAHFIINTATNGRGPLRNPHPSTQGVEDLCKRVLHLSAVGQDSSAWRADR